MFNAGNFQEYDYESEWMECSWKIAYGQIHLVSSYESLNSKNKRRLSKNHLNTHDGICLSTK